MARQKLKLPPASPVALFLGRKDKYKGLEISLQAFAQLHSRYPDLHFLAVGPETTDSQAMWPKYQDLKNLHIHGAVSDEEKLLALQACDFLVLPSVGEAFGIVFLEAWMMGKPVVGARMLAVSAVIDEYRDGLLAEPEDADSLARQIAYLLDRPDRCAAMGQRGRAKVLANYTLPRITDRVEAVYQQVIDTRRGTIRTRPMNSSQLLESTQTNLPEPTVAATPPTAAPSLLTDQTPTADVLEIRDPQLDQQAIRQQVRLQMAQRLQAGGYGPDPSTYGPASLRGIQAPTSSLVVARGAGDLDRELAILTATPGLWEPAFQSSAPVIGRLIVMVRRAWNWMLTKWYVRPILWQLKPYQSTNDHGYFGPGATARNQR